MACRATLGQKSSIYPKIHILKISFFTKFTISFFTKFTISQFHFFTKFTFSNIKFLVIFGQNVGFCPSVELGFLFLLMNSALLNFKFSAVFFRINSHINLHYFILCYEVPREGQLLPSETRALALQPSLPIQLNFPVAFCRLTARIKPATS